MSVQGVTALVIAATGLITAIITLVSHLNLRKKVTRAVPQGQPGQVQEPVGPDVHPQAG